MRTRPRSLTYPDVPRTYAGTLFPPRTTGREGGPAQRTALQGNVMHRLKRAAARVILPSAQSASQRALYRQTEHYQHDLIIVGRWIDSESQLYQCHARCT